MPDKSQAQQVTAVILQVRTSKQKQRKVPDEWQARQAIPVKFQVLVSSSKHNPSNNKEKKEHVCACVRVCVCVCVCARVRTYHNEKKMPDKWQAQLERER